MCNEKGIAFAETLLTVAILFTIMSSLIPLVHRVNNTLYNQKLELHASEVAYDAAKKMVGSNVLNGSAVIEGIPYEWNFDGSAICIKFNNLHEVRNKCIDQEGIIN